MLHHRPKYSIGFFLLLVLLASNACSTKKNTVASRAFHNLTAKYNYFFNANESFKNAEKRAAEQFSYNFTTQLPVLLVGKPQVSSLVGGDMDRAITKCTDLIRHHSITTKPERKRGSMSRNEKDFYNQNEFVFWAREAWLLIGKARAWKGAYPEAEQTFEYVLLQFPNTPMWFEAQVWLARINIINTDFLKANDRLRDISANKKYPKNKYFTHLLSSTWAEYYQKQKQTDKMVPYLEQALSNAPDRSHRVRYTYLLAQVIADQGNTHEANKLFAKVLRMAPGYEMSFNARLQQTALNAKLGKGTSLKRQLLKMTRDDKNIEYLDQIYFAIGSIEQQEGNMEKAIEYYTLSAKKSVSNSNQKGMSYLTLANYFFAKPNYNVSQAYYDSAFNALDDTHPDYFTLEVKTQNLNKLVENLNLVQTEDSLQRIAKMNPRERDVIIAKLISKVREDEQKAKQEEQEDRNRFNQFQQTQQNRIDQTQQGSGWYFYNQSSLSYGQSEFRMRWGQRKLEDNWRRKNKRIVIAEEPIASSEVTDSTGMPRKVIDNKSREFYLQDLPLTDSLIALSNQRIEKALLLVAEVYEKQLKDYPEAIKAYERFTTRFPQSGYAPEVLYNVLQLQLQEGNANGADRSRRTLIANFPRSRFSLMLTNPNFLTEIAEKQREQEIFYQNTFDLFKSNKCADAMIQCRKGIDLYKDTDIEPKLHLMLALCTGSTADLSAYREALSRITKQFPTSEEAKSASEILSILSQRELQLVTTTQTTTKPEQETIAIESKFQAPDGEHLFVAVIPKKSPINQLKFNIISFNVDYFLLINLNVNSRELNDNFDLITVEGFKKQAEAWDYYQKAIAEAGLMGSIPPSDFTMFIISRTNFQTFAEDKSVTDYLKFFQASYR
jgi:tetratricopeptide (TPR) repeat protein